MSTPTQLEQLHLVLGDEEFLVDRAVAQVVSQVRASANVAAGAELPVNRLRAGDAGAAELAELLSPSLFAEDRVVVLEAAAEAGKDAVALVLDAAGDPPPGVVLVILHSGGGRAKAMTGALEKLGAVVHPCAKLKSGELIGFIRGEFRTLGVRVSPDVVQSVFEGVGSNLRELAAACSQLTADTGGKIDVAAVQRYYSGKAEVSGFDVADKAVAGDTAGAIEALRWAMLRGVPHVLLADALADAVHSIARVAPAGRGDPFRMASELGMPPWKIKKAQALAKGWTPTSVGEALRIVAALNADVKGAAADADYAVESAVGRVSRLRQI
ncbi:DNA polymerase III subunit delta [Rhodococcus sp. ACS1]|uniref:DNA polymerase III subunit delta n=1 Tax=Rhodococcus TaxID=1827 RepID=UPI000BB0EDF7|nr:MULTISPECIES: DNA polymerase III subunit delta [Rhodococcus]PBC38720.1 DNA polymerase III subunit delta [Rhodococcus sp. ACS1]QSE78847.1 DNA polymerase III subunit delta [Rhodococcus koreensis]